MKVIIIAAVSKNGVIGLSNGKMPWHIKEEFQHFKETTFGFPVIMGRKTFETLGKPLSGRLNIVITRNRNIKLKSESLKVFNDLITAIKYCNENHFEKIFIIGGGEIYSQSISLSDEMILSHLDFDAEGDVYFPEYDKNDWDIKSTSKREKFEVVHYVRK